MVVTWVHLRSQPHRQAEVLSAVDQLLVQMRRARGCARGRLLGDAEDPNTFVVLAEWATHEDLNTFFESPDFQIFRGIRMLLRGQPSVTIDDVRNRVSRLLR